LNQAEVNCSFAPVARSRPACWLDRRLDLNRHHPVQSGIEHEQVDPVSEIEASVIVMHRLPAMIRVNRLDYRLCNVPENRECR